MLPAGGDEFRRALLAWSTAAPPVMHETEMLAMPVDAVRLSSRFGIRRDPLRGGSRAHLGIDIPDAMGAPVHAAARGTIVFAGWSPGYGNLVQIDHGGGNETRYGHLSAIIVGRGDVVAQGMTIGRVGSTGRSTGPHLHFEVRLDGRAMNPLSRLGSAVTDVAVSAGVAAPLQPRWDGYGQDGLLPQSRLR